MRLKSYLKGFFIFGLILFLGISNVAGMAPITAYAGETTQEVKLNVNSQTIVKGTSFSLYVYNLSEEQTVTYVSSAPAIASVDEEGLITANAVGDATILVTVADAENTIAILSCEIKVGPPAISVQFSRLELAMVVGQKLTLERIVQPLNSVETPKFSSQDRSIATVSAGGRVTAKAEGSTYIFAQINNGRFAVCKIDVYAEEIPLPVETEVTSSTATGEALTISKPKSSEVVIDENDTAIEPVEETTDSETEEALEPVSSEDTLTESEDEVDFETFIKNLNADGKAADEAESTEDNAN